MDSVCWIWIVILLDGSCFAWYNLSFGDYPFYIVIYIYIYYMVDVVMLFVMDIVMCGIVDCLVVGLVLMVAEMQKILFQICDGQ